MTMKNFVRIVIYSTCLIMSVGSLSIDENVGSDAINICSVLSTESAAALFSLRRVAASTPAAVCVCVCVCMLVGVSTFIPLAHSQQWRQSLNIVNPVGVKWYRCFH